MSEQSRPEVDHVRADVVRSLEAEVERLRAALESLFPVDEGYTEAFDELLERGLLTAVPSDQAFRDEWGDIDLMYVWTWRALEGGER